ncbi:MAG TPA: polysaccharide deacetylase family protein [Bacillales bacterium]|nr:polysaccharide deacetylase family protein [Bacillales bacterium]
MDVENLEETFWQTKAIQVPFNYNGCVVTITDDDGHEEFLTNMKPVLDSKGVKCSLSIITGLVGTPNYLTLNQLKLLQDEGFETLSHSKTHSPSIFRDNLPSVPDSVIEAEFRDSQQWFFDNGLAGYSTIVYPWGNYGSQAVRYKYIARKYYKYGVNALGGLNTSPVDNMYLSRFQPLKSMNFNTDIKPVIDENIANKSWLILLNHSYNTDAFSPVLLATIIDYIQSKNIPILTFGEGTRYKGNALSVGEYTDPINKVYIGNDGKFLISG